MHTIFITFSNNAINTQCERVPSAAANWESPHSSDFAAFGHFYCLADFLHFFMSSLVSTHVSVQPKRWKIAKVNRQMG